MTRIQLRLIATLFTALFTAVLTLILFTDWSTISHTGLVITIALWWLCGGISILCFIKAENAPIR